MGEALPKAGKALSLFTSDDTNEHRKGPRTILGLRDDVSVSFRRVLDYHCIHGSGAGSVQRSTVPARTVTTRTEEWLSPRPIRKEVQILRVVLPFSSNELGTSSLSYLGSI